MAAVNAVAVDVSVSREPEEAAVAATLVPLMLALRRMPEVSDVVVTEMPLPVVSEFAVIA